LAAFFAAFFAICSGGLNKRIALLAISRDRVPMFF
jgi:hypothetical protein